MSKAKTNLVGLIMDYESGALGDLEMLEFFGELIISGLVWRLQGHYGRTASALIGQGLIHENGAITDYARDLLSDNDNEQ